METEFEGIKSTRVLTPGDIAHARPYEHHRFTGLEEGSAMMVFSTHFVKEDYCKIESSGKVDLATLKYN